MIVVAASWDSTTSWLEIEQLSKDTKNIKRTLTSWNRYNILWLPPTTMYYKEGTESLKGSPFPPEQWLTAVISLPAWHCELWLLGRLWRLHLCQPPKLFLADSRCFLDTSRWTAEDAPSNWSQYRAMQVSSERSAATCGPHSHEIRSQRWIRWNDS